jgi:hypothetical protein
MRFRLLRDLSGGLLVIFATAEVGIVSLGSGW